MAKPMVQPMMQPATWHLGHLQRQNPCFRTGYMKATGTAAERQRKNKNGAWHIVHKLYNVYHRVTFFTLNLLN
jgi:hypothetical protein